MFHFLRRSEKDDDQAVDADAHDRRIAPQRPSIGLVLGGGAARGFAHIGVIRTLIAKGFTPDIIAGTSIGAVVGGCYAAGKLDDSRQWGRSLTRRSLLGYLDFSFSGSGLLSGGKLADKIDRSDRRRHHRRAAGALRRDRDRDRHRTRDLDHARRAGRGDARVLRAAGHLSAVRIGDRWLVDGALVNPVPVSAARALGARLVIAVNVNTDLFGRGTTIHDHGAGSKNELPIEEEVASRGLFGLFGAREDGHAPLLRHRRAGPASRP